ncbi:hypothetical protein AAG906_024737 [Vitis piasezkii]
MRNKGNNRDQRKRILRKPRSQLLRNKTEANTDNWLWYYAGKLYYLDLQSKDSNKLQQALMADESEGEKKNLKFGCGIDVWDMLPLVRVRSDNGGEYQSSIFKSIWKDMVSFIKLLVPIHPKKWSRERKNWHLLEVVRVSLIAKNTDILLGEAITSATYLINRVPSSSINFQTPLQALTNVVVVPTVPNLPPRVLVAWHLCIYTSTNTPS